MSSKKISIKLERKTILWKLKILLSKEDMIKQGISKHINVYKCDKIKECQGRYQ